MSLKARSANRRRRKQILLNSRRHNHHQETSQWPNYWWDFYGSNGIIIESDHPKYPRVAFLVISDFDDPVGAATVAVNSLKSGQSKIDEVFKRNFELYPNIIK